MYVLIFTDEYQNPRYIQGDLDEINEEFRALWEAGEIDHDEWELKEPWQLLGIEDGRLTPMGNVEVVRVPQFEVH
jgi:hypothetical protein